MKYFKSFVVIILCGSLFVNLSLLSKLDNLENRINSISNSQSQVINSVNSQTNNIRNTINDMKREQSWLSPISSTTTITDIDQGKAAINFEWQIKELKDNSKVVFNYKHGDEKEYISISASEKGNGLFEAVVPIEVILEPEWRIIISDRGDATREIAVKEKIVEEMKKNNELSINYFVSITHDDTIKSSNINVTHIRNLGIQHYGYLETYTDISKDNRVHRVSVIAGPLHNENSTYPEEVYLKKYKNGQLLDEEKLVSSDIDDTDRAGMPTRENSLMFDTETSDEKLDYNSLVIKVIYSDGVSFEEEIYFN